MTVYALLYGVVGLAVGSFLNVAIDRVPEKVSLLKPPSRCPWCGRGLRPIEMVPILSYLRLRGRCASCGAAIPIRVPLTEAATGALFVLLWRVFGPSVDLVFGTIYGCILLVIMVIDLEHKIVPNVIVLPATALALLAIPLRASLGKPPFSHYGLLGPLLVFQAGMKPTLAQVSVLSQLIGGVVAFAIFLVIWLITPQGMGAGDVKLAAFAGIVVAFPNAIAAVMASFVLGGVVSIVLLLTRVAGRKTAIPFAPFLVITTFLAMVQGDRFLHWYVGY